MNTRISIVSSNVESVKVVFSKHESQSAKSWVLVKKTLINGISSNWVWDKITEWDFSTSKTHVNTCMRGYFWKLC